MPSRPRLLDLFCGEGGAAMGYARAGFDVVGVDTDFKRLRHYPFECRHADAIEFLLEHGHEYDAIHGSPTCTGYSLATNWMPDRLERYDRLIPTLREAMIEVGKPYVIENVTGAASELRDPITLCGGMFDLTAVDHDGTKLRLERHRLFESDMPLIQPDHPTHDQTVDVGGSYGHARRGQHNIRRGYVPEADIQRNLLGTYWMTEKGCRLSIPPIYTEYVGAQLLGGPDAVSSQ